MDILVATTNENKIREIREMLDTCWNVFSLKEAGLDIQIEETGKTFEENAIIKAETVRDLTGKIVLADDSGLEIDALGGAPGIYSSRFMGEQTPYDEKNKAILEKLKDVPYEERGARFVCAVAVAFPAEKQTYVRIGKFEGKIASEIKGKNGFGYDPIFFVPEKGVTSAELSAEEKNEMSHRGKALRAAIRELELSIKEGR